ncbi:craniofacial development protein 2-like [Elysia marginata]|uniref:Craniofacial development protein 2-like n=1 Tax=Elysia marginata TaxID=1093978 RepID=A0AAV4IFJ5_9GAST|nr:craniofacial development protein 2-like [Elysia marginata]
MARILFGVPNSCLAHIWLLVSACVRQRHPPGNGFGWPAELCEEEDETTVGELALKDTSGLKPKRGPGADVATLKTRNRPLVIGTWNVRTLYQAGKLDNLIQEADALRVDIMGITETRWKDEGLIRGDNYTMMYSGGTAHEHGVGILIKNDIAKSLMGYWPVHERIILCKFEAKPFNIVIMQVYAPTSDYSDEEVEAFYDDVSKTLKQAKSSDVVIVMGGFNAKVGNTAMSKSIGRYGLGTSNERGERMIQFCEQHVNAKLIQEQISALIPVIMKINIKLKIPRRKSTKAAKYDVSQLKNEELQKKYAVEVKNRFECLMLENCTHEGNEENVNNIWDSLKTAVTETNEVLKNTEYLAL